MINLDFSALVLMEKDMETNYLVKELGSYNVDEGAQYVIKFFYDGEKVNMLFNTHKDVEDWEFDAIYDLFNISSFEEEGYEVDEAQDEYNPTWVLKFDYDEEHNLMEEKVKKACSLIQSEMENVFEAVKDKEEEYK